MDSFLPSHRSSTPCACGPPCGSVRRVDPRPIGVSSTTWRGDASIRASVNPERVCYPSDFGGQADRTANTQRAATKLKAIDVPDSIEAEVDDEDRIAMTPHTLR